MKKELEKVLEIVEKFNNGESITFEEIKTLAYTDISELDTEKWNVTKYEMYVLINRMLEELEEKEVARVYEYTQRIWINSTDEKSD